MQAVKAKMVILGFVFLIGSPEFVSGEMSQNPLTLDEAFLRALEANEQILIAAESLNIALREKERAIAVMLPSIVSEAHYTRRPDEILAPNNNVSRPKEEYDIEFRVRQSLFTGGRARAALNTAREGVQESIQELQLSKEEMLFDVANAYYGVLKSEKNEAIARVEVDRLERHLKAAQSRFNVGEVTKTIVLRAQAELSRARADRVRAEAELKTARDRLALLAKLTQNFQVQDPPEPILPPGTEEDLIQQAYLKRRDLKGTNIREEIAQNDVAFARGRFFPTLSVEGVYSIQDQDPKNPFFFVRIDKRAELTLSFPLFEGGLRLAELQAARSKARQAEFERFLLEDRIMIEVKDAMRDLEAVISVLANFKDQVAFAQENFILVEKQFDFGLATNIDVLDANSLLNEAERQLSNTRYDRDLSVLALRKAVGILLEGMETPGES